MVAMAFLLQLGHEAYEPGTRAYSKIVAEFGQEVVGDGGKIDRKILGPIVFESKVSMLSEAFLGSLQTWGEEDGTSELPLYCVYDKKEEIHEVQRTSILWLKAIGCPGHKVLMFSTYTSAQCGQTESHDICDLWF